MTVTDETKQQLEDFRRDFALLKSEISKVIVGQSEILDDTILALVAGGHVLLEGVPGLGTNMVIESDDGNKIFQFQKGPLFANVLLADEINRATPKTQSALLEAMQEHSVTVGGTTHILDEPFFVLATQNPLEMEGTYPLPEAQLDRFFCKLLVKYPSAREIESILDRTTESQNNAASAVLNGERILEMSAVARTIPITDEVRRYGIALVLATHPDHELVAEPTKKFVRFGASPRGIQALILGAKIRAILDSRFHVAREDLKAMAKPVLRHRLILNFEGQEHVREDALEVTAV